MSFIIVLVWSFPALALCEQIKSNMVATIQDKPKDFFWSKVAAVSAAAAIPLTIVMCCA